MTQTQRHFARAFSQLMKDEEGNLFVLAAIGLLIIMGILALSVDHGRNYMNQADVEAKLTAQTKYAGREYIEWNIGQEIKKLGYGSVTDKQDVLLKVGDSKSEALQKLRDYVSTQVFGSTSPQGACVGMPRVSTNSAGQQQLDFYAKVVQVSNFVIGSEHKQTCNCSSSKASVEDQCTLVQSGVLLPFGFNPENPDFAAQVVFSLDKSSKDNLGANVKDLATKVDNVLKGLNADNPKIYTGVQLGNVPSGVDKSGNAMASLDLKNNNSMGWSGGAYDNSRDRDGTATGSRNEDQSRKYPVMLSIDGQYSRSCSKAVWTYQAESVGQCASSFAYNFPGGTCAAQGLVVQPKGDDTIRQVVDVPGGCDVYYWRPMVYGHWIAACAKGNLTYKSPASVITKVTATFAAKNTPTGDADWSAPLAAVVIDGNEGAGGVGGGQGSSELSSLKAKNTDKSWNNACDTRNRADGAWGAAFGPNGDGYVLNADGTGLSGAANNNCTVAEFQPAGGVQTVNFEFRDNGYGDGNFPQGFYRADMEVSGLGGGQSPAGAPVPPGGATPPSAYGWVYNGVPLNAAGTADGAPCPAPNAAPMAFYAKGWDVPVPSLPPEVMNIASASTEFGTDINGNIVAGLLDSFDYDINNGEEHPKGSPPVVNNDDGDGKALADKGDGATYPWFFRGASPANLVEHPFLNDGFAKKHGVLHLVGSNSGADTILGWWPHGVVDCQSDPKIAPPNWCYSTIPFIDLNVVKDYRIKTTTDHDATGGTDNYDVMDKNGNLKAVSFIGAQNLPTAFGNDSYQSMIAELKRGYDGYGIYGGMDGNQCALLKAGLSQVESVDPGNTKMRRGLIFVGSCPPASWADSNLDFHGESVRSWFANGNAVAGGKPGTLSPAPYLETLSKPGDHGTGLLNQTQSCFSQVKGEVDGFMVLTAPGCNSLASLSSDLELGTPGSTGCELGTTPTADCIRRFILATVPLEGREVKK